MYVSRIALFSASSTAGKKDVVAWSTGSGDLNRQDNERERWALVQKFRFQLVEL